MGEPFIFIFSCHRRMISWKKMKSDWLDAMNINYAFVTGEPELESEYVWNEKDKEIIVKAGDSYDEQSYKLIGGMRAIDDIFKPSYILKCDDDIIVNIKNLKNMLANPPSDYCGRVNTGIGWSTYASERFNDKRPAFIPVPFCSGPIIYVGRKAIDIINKYMDPQELRLCDANLAICLYSNGIYATEVVNMYTRDYEEFMNGEYIVYDKILPYKVVSTWMLGSNFPENMFPDGSVIVGDYTNNHYEQGKKHIYIQVEPEVIYPQKDFLLHYGHLYEKIYTYIDEVIEKFPHAIKYAGSGGGTIFNITEDISNKEFKISSWASTKILANIWGHEIRQHIYYRQKEFPENVTFFRSIMCEPHLPEIGNNPFMGRKLYGGRDCLFDGFQFSIQIENSIQKNYFTDRIIDCLVTKTIPIYRGCPNIGEYFDTTGWLFFDTVDELIAKVRLLTPDYYSRYTEVINNNAKKALKYANFYTLF